MATTRQIRPISERVIGYPPAAPQDETTLIQTDVEALEGLGFDPEYLDNVLEYRKAILSAIRSYERKAITSPEVVLEMLSGKYRTLQTLAGRWLTYTLNAKRERITVPHPKKPGEMVYQNVVTKAVPTIERLTDQAPIPHGGIYLVVYGGSPGVLSQDGVADEIAALWKTKQVADIVLWHLEPGQPGALYSLAKGQGSRDNVAVPFPDAEALEKARTV